MNNDRFIGYVYLRNEREQKSRDYHNETRAERDKLRKQLDDKDDFIEELAKKLHFEVMARDAADRKLAMAVEALGKVERSSSDEDRCIAISHEALDSVCAALAALEKND